MTRCLIADVYNIINSWPELKSLGENSLEHSRDKLLEFVEDYRVYNQSTVKLKISLIQDGLVL